MLEDKVLVWKLRRGNTDALRFIYEKYRDDLLRIAASLLRDKSKAEDAVHDVFTAFVSASASFTLTGSLRGYFTTCVANKARNINRTTSRRQAVSHKYNKNSKSRVRSTISPNLINSYTGGAAFLQDVSNDRATKKQTITLIENEYSIKKDLLCLQRLEEDGRFPFMQKGRRFKRLCYIDPNRDYVCVRIEEYFIQDEQWKKLFKDADRFLIKNQDASLGYTKLEIRESTELDQSEDGKWHSKRIEMRTTTQRGNGKLQKSSSAFTIYLDTGSEIPEDTFDPDAFSKFLK